MERERDAPWGLSLLQGYGVALLLFPWQRLALLESHSRCGTTAFLPLPPLCTSHLSPRLVPPHCFPALKKLVKSEGWHGALINEAEWDNHRAISHSDSQWHCHYSRQPIPGAIGLGVETLVTETVTNIPLASTSAIRHNSSRVGQNYRNIGLQKTKL